MIIDITIKNRRAETAHYAAPIVCKNSDYQVRFNFDAEWAAHELKTARFYASGKKIDVPFTGDICDIPELSNTTGVYIGVFAGDLKTTTAAYVPCERSIIDMGGENEAPTENVYNRLVALSEETLRAAESANGNASSAVETANEAKETADNVTEAEQARAAAEQGRADAEQSRATAEQGRTTADQGRADAEQSRATAEQGRAEAEAERETAINAAAPSIINTVTGEFITVTEAAKRSIYNIKVAGKTGEGGEVVKEGTLIRSTGKNFVEITADSTRSLGGLTVSITKENNTCIINGIVGGTNSFSTTYRARLAAGTYTASVIGLNVIDSRADRIYIFDAESREILLNYITTQSAGSFTLTEAREVGITFVFATGSEYNNAAVYVQIEAGAAATAYEPYITGGEIITPCDLSAGDVWHPLTGIVERGNGDPAEQYEPQTIATCYGVTNITQTPVELTAPLYIDYVADTKLYIQNVFNLMSIFKS